MSWHGSAVFFKRTKRRDHCEAIGDRRARPRHGEGDSQNDTMCNEEDDKSDMFFVDHWSIKNISALKPSSLHTLSFSLLTYMYRRTIKKLDRGLTASIIEALFYRIKREMQCAEEIKICSYNARCYNNDTLPPMLPYICQAASLKLKVYIHLDACCSKICIDARFVVSFRHLKRYIMETGYNVLTLEDIIDSLI